MGRMLICLAIIGLAGPAVACINDVELPSHEREFRSQYLAKVSPVIGRRAASGTDAILVLERTPGHAIIIGGEVRVEVAEASFPHVRLRITRLGSTVRPSGGDAGVVANIGDCTVIKHEGQSFGIGRSRVRIERVSGDRVILAVEHGGDTTVFGEEVWEALGPG